MNKKKKIGCQHISNREIFHIYREFSLRKVYLKSLLNRT